jgi:hypothetical protein
VRFVLQVYDRHFGFSGSVSVSASGSIFLIIVIQDIATQPRRREPSNFYRLWIPAFRFAKAGMAYLIFE